METVKRNCDDGGGDGSVKSESGRSLRRSSTDLLRLLAYASRAARLIGL